MYGRTNMVWTLHSELPRVDASRVKESGLGRAIAGRPFAGLVAVLTLALCSPVGGSRECRGDCDADGTTTVSDVLLQVSIALRIGNPDECPGADRDGDGQLGRQRGVDCETSASYRKKRSFRPYLAPSTRGTPGRTPAPWTISRMKSGCCDSGSDIMTVTHRKKRSICEPRWSGRHFGGWAQCGSAITAKLNAAL